MPCTASAVATARTSSTAFQNYTVIGVKIGAAQTLVIRMAAIFLCKQSAKAITWMPERDRCGVLSNEAPKIALCVRMVGEILGSSYITPSGVEFKKVAMFRKAQKNS